MGKLVIKFQGRAVGDVDLKLGDTTIGRKPSSDVVLDDPAVSSDHAVIKTVGNKSTIHDLDSTNGTFIENSRIKQHELKNGETIIIGAHSLLYRDVVNLGAPPPAKKSAAAPASAGRKTTLLLPFAQLLGVEGKEKDKRMPLVKDVVTIDNPGKSPARITRTADGYLMEASIGAGEPRLNDKPVPPGGVLLENGDIIDCAGSKYRFFY